MDNNLVFWRIRRGLNGEVIEDIWCITPVKGGVGEVRGKGKRKRIGVAATRVDVGMLG